VESLYGSGKDCREGIEDIAIFEKDAKPDRRS
jgi:hypothetical protein